jgi:CubicO group peptidase (beta-lactamase class C family)
VRGRQFRGDAELSAGLHGLTGGRPHRVAVAAIDRSICPGVRFAFVNAGGSTRFEIGSVTKGLTGMLLADSVERGEIALDTTVSAVFPETAVAEAGSITVTELCTHTSGLPRSVRRPFAAWRGLRHSVLQLNPYHGMTTALMLEQAAAQQLSERGHRRYSNLGAALLGQLLAARGGAEYAVPPGADPRAFGHARLGCRQPSQHRPLGDGPLRPSPSTLGHGRLRPGGRRVQHY